MTPRPYPFVRFTRSLLADGDNPAMLVEHHVDPFAVVRIAGVEGRPTLILCSVGGVVEVDAKVAIAKERIEAARKVAYYDVALEADTEPPAKARERQVAELAARDRRAGGRDPDEGALSDQDLEDA